MVLPDFLAPGSSDSFSHPLINHIKTILNQSNIRYKRKAYGISEGWGKEQGQHLSFFGEHSHAMCYIEKRVYFREKVKFIILSVFANLFQPINSNNLC